MPAGPQRSARLAGEGAPANGSGLAKRWANRGHCISWEEEEGTRECRELAKEEGKQGGVEALPPLEEEEGDVGGSGQVEGLLVKWGNLELLLRRQIRSLEPEQKRSCLGIPFQNPTREPRPGSPASLKTYRMLELAETNFQPNHCPRENAEALKRSDLNRVKH